VESFLLRPSLLHEPTVAEPIGSNHRRPVECPSADDLAAYLQGRVGGDEGTAIVRHLEVCEHCTGVLLTASRVLEHSSGTAELESALDCSLFVSAEETRCRKLNDG